MPLPLEPDPPNGIRRPPPPELDKETYPLEDLKPEDVTSIQERCINVNEYYNKEFVVCLREDFLPIPPNESPIDRVSREIKGPPVIVVPEEEAIKLGERLEMKLGDVQWFTPRRQIPFGPPQRFFVPKESRIGLEQDRMPASYTDLPIPPTPEAEKKKIEAEIEKEKLKREKKASAGA